MKGNRTIIFNILMTVVGLFGFKLNPDLANHWLDVFVPAWGIGAILLRQITNTPVGAAVNSEIALLTDHVRQLLGQVSQGLSKDDIASLATDVRTLLGYASSDTALAGMTKEVAAAVTALVPNLQAIVAALPSADVSSLNTPAPVATPVAEAAVSAIAADGPVPPSQGSSAQPSAETWPSAPAPTIISAL